jgi:hypothetical protein
LLDVVIGLHLKDIQVDVSSNYQITITGFIKEIVEKIIKNGYLVIGGEGGVNTYASIYRSDNKFTFPDNNVNKHSFENPFHEYRTTVNIKTDTLFNINPHSPPPCPLLNI